MVSVIEPGLDFENTSEVVVQIKAEDDDFLYTEKSLTVSVQDEAVTITIK